MSEDYTKARPLGRIYLHGEEFRVVRKRVLGKPWRKYLALIHRGRQVSDRINTTDPIEATAAWRGKLEATFGTREKLLAAIASLQPPVVAP